MKLIKIHITKKMLLTIFLGLLLITIGYTQKLPQERRITGKVISSEGFPLAGVNVIVKGTDIGSMSDFDGNYSITVSIDHKTLLFSYLGYKNLEINIGSTDIIHVNMEEDVTVLDDVVVIGYGTQKRENLIGAVSKVQSENIENQQVATFEQALIGQVSGVQFRDGGAPDGGPQLTIRGVSTFGNNNPLYIVDGFPLGTNAGVQRDNYILNAINPADIESISVLKDAASKAIYGSRASNGVIIITTKKGRVNTKPIITFSTNVGIQSIPDYETPDVLNARALYQYQLEYYDDLDVAGVNLGGLQQANRAFLIGLDRLESDNNWFDLISRDGIVKNYGISVSGGSPLSRYHVSLSHQDREGTLIHTGFKRYAFNLNFDTKISDRLKLNLNFAPTRSVATGGRTDAGAGNFSIFNAVALSSWTDPTASLFDEEGRLTGVTQGQLIFRSRNINPVTLLSERVDIRRSDLLRMGGFLEWEPIKGLKAKTFGSFQYIDRRNRNFTPSRFPGSTLFANLEGTGQASARLTRLNALNMVWENTLSYSYLLGTDQQHSIDLLAGFTVERRESNTTTAISSNLVDEEIQLPSAGNSVEPGDFTGGTASEANALTSLIGRLHYNYDARYYLTATIRRDGSSKFGKENRYGNFPSFGAAWRISNEKFFDGLKAVISELKLEGGYGISGNNSNIGNYTAQGQVGINQDYNFDGLNAPGAAITGLPNRAAKWEETIETNLGINLGFFNNRIIFSADYYNTRSVDFLFNLPLPATSGFGGIIANLGEISNKGIELELIGRIIEKPDVNWTVNLNYTANRNEVIDIPQEQGFFFPGGSGIAGINITEIREGQAIGLFRGLKVTGLFTQEEIDNPDIPKYGGAIEGSLKFEDVPTIDTDGDGVPDEADGVLDNRDATIIGNPNPDFLIGMSSQFNYKNIDLSVTLDGAFGQDVFLAQNQYLANQDDGQFNIDRRLLERFRPGDDPTTKIIPGVGSTTSRQFFRRPNSLAIQSADYLWIRNITLGYRIEGEIINGIFQTVRLYISAQNPFLFTEYEYGSPTVRRAADNAAVRNIDNGAYPISRTVSMGFDITF